MKYLALVLASLCFGCSAISDLHPAYRGGRSTVEIQFARGFDPCFEPGCTVQLVAVGPATSDGVRRLVGSEVTWRSFTRAVATISPEGLITVIAPGEAVIAAECNVCGSDTVEEGILITNKTTGTFTFGKPPFLLK